jgi:predicted membrane protein
LLTIENILLLGLALLVLAIIGIISIGIIYAIIRYIDYKFPKKSAGNSEQKEEIKDKEIVLDDIPDSKKKNRKKLVEDNPMEIQSFEVTSSFEGKRIGQIKGD